MRHFSDATTTSHLQHYPDQGRIPRSRSAGLFYKLWYVDAAEMQK